MQRTMNINLPAPASLVKLSEIEQTRRCNSKSGTDVIIFQDLVPYHKQTLY